MTNAMTKKDYIRYKNQTFELFEFYPDPSQPGGFKRGTHTSGADLPTVARASMRTTSRGGFILTCSHAVFYRAREIDQDRGRNDNSRTFYGWAYPPIAALIEKAATEIQKEFGRGRVIV